MERATLGPSVFQILLLMGTFSCSMNARIVEDSVLESGSTEPSYSAVFTAASQVVTESVGTVTITVSIGEVALRDSAFAYTVSGTSTAADHNLIDGTAYINVGQSSVDITFQVINDSLDEGDETIIVTLLNNLTTHIVTIQDNDPLPTITLSAGSGYEGSTVDFPVTLSAASGRDVSFTYSVSHTTTSGADFSGVLTGSFTIPAGQTSVSLSLPTVQDDLLDGEETFTLNLSAPVNAAGVTASVNGTLYELLVETIYPNYGANWNDYVQLGLDFPLISPNAFLKNGHPNGAMQKRVSIPAFTSCNGLALVDSLDVFEWRCRLVSGKVEFNIFDFKLGKGLKNLVTEAGFNPIKVQLTENAGPVIMESTLLNGWWTNPIIPLPDNSGGAIASLNTAGAIYVEDTSKNTRGYSIDAHRISVVTGPGALLTLENSTPNNCDNFAETATPTHVAAVCLGSADYTWLEINLQHSANAQRGIYMQYAYFFRIHGTTIRGDGNDWAIYSNSSVTTYGHISQSRISNTYVGIYISTSPLIIEDTEVENISNTFYGAVQIGWGISGTRFSRVRVFNSADEGIILDSSHDAIFQDVVVANNASHGIIIDGEDTNLVNVLAFNNGGGGVVTETGVSSERIHMLNVTSVNNTGAGITPSNAWNESFTSYSNLVNSVALNNGTGVLINQGLGTAEMALSNLFLAFNSLAMSFNNIRYFSFFDLVSIGSNTANCSVTNSGANPEVGITHTTCALVTPSTGTLSTTLNPTASFVGKAGTDSVNTTAGANVNTAIAVGSITDRINFQNWYRAWGKEGSAFPNSDHRGRCTAGTCNIWDFRLALGDTVLRNVNGTFVDGAACPASVSGNVVLSQKNALKYAIEIPRDGIGNDNGLCESNESCWFSPNAGAYQGDVNGDYLSHSCIFQNGAVTNVLMYRLPEL